MVNTSDCQTQNDMMHDTKPSGVLIPCMLNEVWSNLCLKADGGSVSPKSGKSSRSFFVRSSLWSSMEKSHHPFQHVPSMWYLDSFISSMVDFSIEAAPSSLPPKKYCDLTGFEAMYTDPRTGLRYANLTAYKLLKEFPEHSLQQLLSLRNAAQLLK